MFGAQIVGDQQYPDAVELGKRARRAGMFTDLGSKAEKAKSGKLDARAIFESSNLPKGFWAFRDGKPVSAEGKSGLVMRIVDKRSSTPSPIPVQGMTSPAIRADQAAKANAMRAEYLRLLKASWE